MNTALSSLTKTAYWTDRLREMSDEKVTKELRFVRSFQPENEDQTQYAALVDKEAARRSANQSDCCAEDERWIWW